MLPNIWKCKKLSSHKVFHQNKWKINKKKKIYKTTIRPIKLYGTKCWAIKK